MNNFAINTDGSNQDGNKYTELLSYWNLYHVDEAVRTKWIFYTYIDNLSFLGGLLDISLLIPSFLMIGYTFRLNEINVFFYQQIMEKWNDDQKDKGKLEKLNVNPNTKYSQFILDNYFWISFKVGIWIVISKSGVLKIISKVKEKWGGEA